MEERSAFDILTDYPKKHGLDYDTQDDYRKFFLFPRDPILGIKFVIFKSGPFYFYAFDSFAAKLSMSETFTGLYGLANQEAPELKIYKKDFTDTFLRTNKRKTGFDHIDNHLTITSDTKNLSFHLSPPAVTLFLQMAERFSPLHLVIENNYISNIAGLKDKKVIGLETGQWLYKEEDIDLFLELGQKLIKQHV